MVLGLRVCGLGGFEFRVWDWVFGGLGLTLWGEGRS